MQQLSLSGTFDKYRKRTKQEIFLEKMDNLIPWKELCAVIEPHYPKVGNGRPPRGLERMLRMYFVAHWFNLADEACEDFLYNMPAARHFCKFDLGNEPIPDATTLENFRHLLERHKLGEQLFAAVGSLLDGIVKLTFRFKKHPTKSHHFYFRSSKKHTRNPRFSKSYVAITTFL